MLASIALHAGALIGLVIYSWMHIDELTPPAVVLRFFSVPPPPPPPLGSRPRSEHHAKARSSAPAAPSIPAPTVAPTHADLPNDTANDETGDPNDEPVGDPHGDPHGQRGGPPGGPPAHEAVVAGFTLTASRVSASLPHLPDWFIARHAKETVHATFMICLDTSGHVSRVSTVRAIAGNVDDTIIDQIKSTWTYRPQRLPVCFAQPFAFHID